MSYRVHIDGQFMLDRPLTVEHKVTLDKFAGERHAESQYPGAWCPWVPGEMGTTIRYTDEEINGYSITEWLQVVVDRFLKPWGYVLNGRAQWAGEEAGDLGVIAVRDNEVRDADAVITYPDPFD